MIGEAFTWANLTNLGRLHDHNGTVVLRRRRVIYFTIILTVIATEEHRRHCSTNANLTVIDGKRVTWMVGWLDACMLA